MNIQYKEFSFRLNTRYIRPINLLKHLCQILDLDFDRKNFRKTLVTEIPYFALFYEPNLTQNSVIYLMYTTYTYLINIRVNTYLIPDIELYLQNLQRSKNCLTILPLVETHLINNNIFENEEIKIKLADGKNFTYINKYFTATQALRWLEVQKANFRNKDDWFTNF